MKLFLLVAICFLTLFGIGSGVWIGTKITASQYSLVNLPDGKHLHQLYIGDTLEQEFVNPGSSLSGITIFADHRTRIGENTNLHFSIRDIVSGNILREGTEQIRQLGTVGEIYLNFETLRGLSTQRLVLYIELLETDGSPFYIRYQSDATKYMQGRVVINGVEKQGSIGFLLSEQPTVAEMISRWVDQHSAIWIGVIFIVAGFVFAAFWHREKKYDSEFWYGIFQRIRLQKYTHLALMGIIFAITVSVYLPGSREFFVQDDIPIILRAKEFLQNQPLSLFTNHPYLAPDEVLSTTTPFYRPVSFSLYPALLYGVFGLNFTAFFFSNLILFGLTAIGLYILTVIVLRSPWFAFIASLAWVIHPTKLPLVYWWSSSQDILAGFFSVATILLYVYYRAYPSTIKKVLVFAAFIMALFSKEYAVFVIPIILLLEILCGEKDGISASTVQKIGQYVARIKGVISPTIIILGIYIVLRVITLGDPTIPIPTQRDHSYDFSLSPATFMRNTIAYLDWVVVGHDWQDFMPWMELQLKPLLASLSDYEPPYAPGILFALVVGIAALFLKKDAKKHALFGIVWFLLFLAPILFLSHEQQARWLSLPIYGLCLLLVLEAQYFLANQILLKKILFAVTVALLIVSSFTSARMVQNNPTHELAQQALSVISQYKTQEGGELSKRLIFVDFPYDMRGTINRGLIQLVYDVQFSDFSYVNVIDNDAINGRNIIIFRR